MKNIERIYVCYKQKENFEIIEKILIQYVDESSTYISLPSYYNKTNNKRKQKEQTRIKEKLEEYIEELSTQNNSGSNYLEKNKVIIVTEEDLELKEYMDSKINEIEQNNLKKDEKSNISTGNMLMFLSIIMDYIIFLPISNGIISIITLVINMDSFQSFLRAIKKNLQQNSTKKEEKHLKLLKRSFSCVMLLLNILLGINNLKVNYDDMSRDARLFTLIMTEPMEGFLDENERLQIIMEDDKASVLMEALDKNPIINEEDAEIAISLTEYIEENPYITNEELYEIFATLEILHSNNLTYGNISGSYQRVDNIIRMYESSYESKEVYEDVMQHEMIHATGDLDNRLLTEGMATLLQAEYSNDTTINSAYYDHVLLTKIFCELITPEKMLEAYTKQDTNIIKEEMLKLNPNKEDYNNLMNAMQEYAKNYKEIHREFISNPSISEEDVPSYQFYKLLEPYYNSDKISIDTKETILFYIEPIGYWIDVDSEPYFNKENKVLTYY